MNKSFSIHPIKETDSALLDYFGHYDIDINTLNKYNVIALESYQHYNNTVTASDGNPIIAYEIIKGKCCKIYRPFALENQMKFSWLGKKPDGFIFGFEQLDINLKEVYIVGGEKDVLTMNSLGYNAISLNSETAIPDVELIKSLQTNFAKVTVLYDLDETGLKMSKKICEKFGLERIVLPGFIEEKKCKDISDCIKAKYHFEDISMHKEQFKIAPKATTDLEKILASQRILKQNKQGDIHFSDPVLTQFDYPFIYPNTINVIQGKSGTHKSRLAQLICSVLIKKKGHLNNILNLKKTESNIAICYVDTERNIKDQLPYALQQIQVQAGYNKEEHPVSFDYVSLIEVKREKRFQALRDYIIHLNNTQEFHLFIVLDVITDCVTDFNRSQESMELIDLMNETINQHFVTFLCLIHKNPGSESKARGHLGTEITNKASTIIQINFENTKGQEESDLLKMKFIKCRNNKRPGPIYLQYDESKKILVQADSDYVQDFIMSKQEVASTAEIIDLLKNILTEPKLTTSLINTIKDEIGGSDKTIRARLKEVLEKQMEIINNDKIICTLCKKQEGNKFFYSLEKLK